MDWNKTLGKHSTLCLIYTVQTKSLIDFIFGLVFRLTTPDFFPGSVPCGAAKSVQQVAPPCQKLHCTETHTVESNKEERLHYCGLRVTQAHSHLDCSSLALYSLTPTALRLHLGYWRSGGAANSQWLHPQFSMMLSWAHVRLQDCREREAVPLFVFQLYKKQKMF